MQENKEIYLLINDEQCVKLKGGSIKFKNNFEQLALPFKIYADFDCVLKGVKSNDKNKKSSYTEEYQDHLSCYFSYKLVCINDRFSKRVVLYRVKKCCHVYRRWRKI